MIPARQHLEAGEPPVLQRHERLVEGHDLARRNGAAEIGLERRAPAQRLAHARLEIIEGAAAALLGLAEGDIRRAQEVFGIGFGEFRGRDADRGADREHALRHPDRRRDAVDQPPGNAARQVDDRLVLDQEAELVAAETRDGGPDRLEGAEPPRDLDEQHVADAVAVQVIDVAEAVEIDGEQREGRPAGAAAFDGPLQLGEEGGAVQDARQRIDLREKAELLLAVERLVEAGCQLAEAAQHDERDRGTSEDRRGGDDLAARIQETGAAGNETER